MTPDPKAGAVRVVRSLRLISRVGQQQRGRLAAERELLAAWGEAWISANLALTGWAGLAFLATVGLTLDAARQVAIEVAPQEVVPAETLLRDLLRDVAARLRCGRCRTPVRLPCGCRSTHEAMAAP